MYLDLNIPWPTSHLHYLLNPSSASSSFNHPLKSISTPTTNSSAIHLDIWKGIPNQDRIRLRDSVDCAIRLGYTVIAFNLIIPQSIDPSLLAPHFPFSPDQPPFPDLDPRTAPNPSIPLILQLSRLTVLIDQNVVKGGKGIFGFPKSQDAYFSQYSILSAMPLDGPAFAHACLSLSSPSPTGIDLICLDLASSPKLPFHMPLSTVSHALQQGVHFEVIYSPSTNPNLYPSFSTHQFPILAPSTSTRKNLIHAIKELIRVTNCGKGLVISSAARSWAELRAPDDVVNLFNVLGLSHEHGRRAMTKNPKSMVSRALSTRQTHKGVISNPIVKTTRGHGRQMGSGGMPNWRSSEEDRGTRSSPPTPSDLQPPPASNSLEGDPKLDRRPDSSTPNSKRIKL